MRTAMPSLIKFNILRVGLFTIVHGKLLVFNQPAYDITFVPREVTQLDTLDFCHALNITLEQFQKRMKRCEKPLDESWLF